MNAPSFLNYYKKEYFCFILLICQGYRYLIGFILEKYLRCVSGVWKTGSTPK